MSYKAIISSLFTYNSICIISDGLECKAGSVSADLNRFMTWKTSDGLKEASRFKPQLETMFEGMLKPAILLDLIRNFIVFEKTKKEDTKTGVSCQNARVNSTKNRVMKNQKTLSCSFNLNRKNN